MKLLITISLFAFLAGCSGSASKEEKVKQAASIELAFDIVADAKPLAPVYLLTSDPNPEVFDGSKLGGDDMDFEIQQPLMLAAALYDLLNYVRSMSGAELEIRRVDSPDDIRYPAIVIGELARKAGITPPVSKTNEGFTLKITPQAIYIAGASQAGDVYGIYELLERLGCAWVMPGVEGEVIPHVQDRLSIVVMETSQAPSFEIRCPWYSGNRETVTAEEQAKFLQWKMRNKLQVSRNVHPLQMRGGHVWGTLTKGRYREAFEKDPEMLALRRLADGSYQRMGPQIETTNPKVIDLMERYIREMFAENNWPHDKLVNIGVGPDDGGGASESPESMAAGSGRIDPTSGNWDITDLQILLCNQLLERLEKDFPNLHLGFYLYSYHGDYPVKYVPHPKITITLADISYSRIHGNVEGTSRSREYLLDILEKWGALSRQQGNPILFRGYNWNLADNILPMTKIKIWGEDFPFYHRMGVIGVYNECSKSWSVNGPGDYLESRLLWNVERPWQEEFSIYCRKAFAEGAPFMEQYYLNMAERQSTGGVEAGSYWPFALIYDDAFLASQQKLLNKAAAAVQSRADVAERVRIASIPMETMKRFLTLRQAYLGFDFTKAETVFSGLQAYLQQEIDKNGMAVCRTGASRYLERFYKEFIEKGKENSTGDNRIEFQVPDVLPVMIDPFDNGESFGYYRSDLIDRDFVRLKTVSSTWDAQGLDGLRRGSVWYRIHFTLPKIPENREIGFFLGGGDGQFHVWLNGHKLGVANGSLRPFIFSLNPSVEREGDNVLVIKVYRRSHAELGIGGLVYPSFIFSTDKVNESENLIKEVDILPGWGG